MKRVTYFILITSLSLCCIEIPIASATNLIINGDFEAGNTGFSTGYQYYNGTDFQLIEGRYAIGVDPYNYHQAAASYGDHTSGQGNMMIVNGISSPDVTLWQQTISVLQNTDYEFSLWLSN
jgi:hypothetical protein